MTSHNLADTFRAVLLKHSRSLVDHDGEPTDELLAELVAVVERHVVGHSPARSARVKRPVEDAA